MVEDGRIILEKVDTQGNVVDDEVKYVSIKKFRWYNEDMGI